MCPHSGLWKATMASHFPALPTPGERGGLTYIKRVFSFPQMQNARELLLNGGAASFTQHTTANTTTSWSEEEAVCAVKEAVPSFQNKNKKTQKLQNQHSFYSVF
jgi:hypothetical protein